MHASSLLPANGVPPELMTVETGDDIASEFTFSPDICPRTDNPCEDIVYNDSSDMSSFYLLVSSSNKKLKGIPMKL